LIKAEKFSFLEKLRRELYLWRKSCTTVE